MIDFSSRLFTYWFCENGRLVSIDCGWLLFGSQKGTNGDNSRMLFFCV